MSPDPTPAPQPPDYEPGRSPTPELDPANTPEEMPDVPEIPDPAPDVGRPFDVGSILKPDIGGAPSPLGLPAPWPDGTPRP